MQDCVLGARGRLVHAPVKSPVERLVPLAKGDDAIRGAQRVGDERLVEAVDHGIVVAPGAEPAAPGRRVLSDAADVRQKRQPVQHLRSLRMSEGGNVAARMSGRDRPHGRRREQRVANARDVDEKKRGAAGRHSNVAVAMQGLTHDLRLCA